MQGKRDVGPLVGLDVPSLVLGRLIFILGRELFEGRHISAPHKEAGYTSAVVTLGQSLSKPFAIARGHIRPDVTLPFRPRSGSE
jgi:hypothetical protein